MTTPNATDWGRYGLADIWDMVRHDNYDNFSHVRAWKKMEELCHGMAGSLRTAATELAQQWPPEQSPAAAAFKDTLDKLANKFNDAGLAAGGNGPTLSEVNTGFAQSRGKIVGLCQSWERMEYDEAVRVAIARRVLPTGALGATGGVFGAFTGAVRGGLSGGVPGAIAGATVGGVAGFDAAMSDRQVLAFSNTAPARQIVDAAGAPSVPTNWRQDLDQQAREVMAATDREIAEAHSHLQEPPILDPRSDHVTVPQSGAGIGLGGGFTPPPAPRSPAGLPERTPTSVDPVLDGWQPGAGPSSGSSVASPIGAGAPVPSAGGSVPWVMTPAGPALAPGGVIGERAPVSRVPLGAVPGGVVPVAAAPVRPAAGSGAGGGFVAPPGGLIGGAPAGRGAAPMGGAAAARAARRRGDDDGDWVVPAGVPGVLRPDPEPEMHDPGPGVIGIDR